MAGNDVTELDESRLFQLAVSLEKGLLGNMLLIVYCGGAATTLGVLLSRNLRFRRRLRKARVEMIPMEQLGEYVQRCSALHIRPLPVWRVEGQMCIRDRGGTVQRCAHPVQRTGQLPAGHAPQAAEAQVLQ